jgi:hypothetical protein
LCECERTYRHQKRKQSNEVSLHDVPFKCFIEVIIVSID